MKSILLFFSMCIFSLVVSAESTYEVPVKSEKLARFAKFELPNLEVDDSQVDSLRLSFNMPHELVGAATIPVSLEQVAAVEDGNFKLHGDLASANCSEALSETASNLTCTIRYAKQNYYGPGVLYYLLRNDYDHPISRARVALKFSTDPIGILKITRQRR